MVKIFCKLCLQPVAAAEWKSHITQKRHLQELPAKIVVKGTFITMVCAILTHLSS